MSLDERVSFLAHVCAHLHFIVDEKLPCVPLVPFCNIIPRMIPHHARLSCGFSVFRPIVTQTHIAHSEFTDKTLIDINYIIRFLSFESIFSSVDPMRNEQSFGFPHGIVQWISTIAFC